MSTILCVLEYEHEFAWLGDGCSVHVHVPGEMEKTLRRFGSSTSILKIGYVWE